MNPAHQAALPVPDNDAAFHYQTWPPQFPPAFQFEQPATDHDFGFQQFHDQSFGYQTYVDPPHLTQSYSGSFMYPQPSTNPVPVFQQQQVPVLTAHQQQQHSVWLQMAKQGSASMQCKPPFEWSQQLHNKFMKAVDELGGLHKAKPASILKKMSGYGLSRLTVKSHLQTCRRKEKAAETAGMLIAGGGEHNSSEGIREQDQVQHETASESLASNYASSELEKDTLRSLIAESLKFIENELEQETNKISVRNRRHKRLFIAAD